MNQFLILTTLIKKTAPTPVINKWFNLRFILVTVMALLSCHAQADCDHVGAYIVNLSQDIRDRQDPNICTSRDTDALIRECIAGQIAINLDNDCETNFDVYVPGTNAEHGAWNQFNHMFRTDNNRAHLSLQYDDDSNINTLDGAFYDNGVIESRKSLILLLDALVEYFEVESIRVFGHSKGSHTVSMVSMESDYSDFEFYAFAQPGRTAVNIDNDDEIVEAPLGTPGFIEKLSENLVGITWKNDEVQYYTGDGYDGLSLPEIFSFPGYVWQENTGGGASLFNYLHIDHHNNYGGLYTDGLESNNYREGEGSRDMKFPYCATGDQYIAEDAAECEKQPSSKYPYFWGTPECVEQAFKMMNTDTKDAHAYEIGYSGPRVPGSCKSSPYVTKVDYELRYQFNLPDQDCVYKLRFGFKDVNSQVELDTFSVSGTTDDDQTWHEKTGSIFVPIHMNLTVKATIDERSSTCLSAFESEAYIEHLIINFIHPGNGLSKSRTLIGMREGRGSTGSLHRWDNVAWEQPNLTDDTLRMYYSSSKNSLKIENQTGNWTDPSDEGSFQKRVHVID